MTSDRHENSDLLKPEDAALNVSQVMFPNPRESAFNEPLSAIRNREELEDRRARAIMRASFHNERSELVQKWIDRETGETSTDRHILDFKFDVRYGADQLLPLTTSHNSAFSYERTNGSSSHNTIFAGSLPLASSTPRTSPQQIRRRLLPPELPSARRADSSTNFDHDASFSDSTECLLRMDNNANPVGRRPVHNT
uniref:Uncharacterized protein n=1 Tax=Caenorhabditis japonica TaxID=281687 RepID=A0A8R1EBR9_CAEJA